MSALDDFIKFIENGSVLTDPIDVSSSMHINAYYDHYFLEDAKRSLAAIRTENERLQIAVEWAEYIFTLMSKSGTSAVEWLREYGKEKK